MFMYQQLMASQWKEQITSQSDEGLFYRLLLLPLLLRLWVSHSPQVTSQPTELEWKQVILEPKEMHKETLMSAV